MFFLYLSINISLFWIIKNKSYLNNTINILFFYNSKNIIPALFLNIPTNPTITTTTSSIIIIIITNSKIEEVILVMIIININYKFNDNNKIK